MIRRPTPYTLTDTLLPYRTRVRGGVDWQFNGRQWRRQEPADPHDDGVDAPRRQSFAALPEKASELNYRATLAAVDLAAGEAPGPKDPYRLPAGEGDRPSLRPADWRPAPDTGQRHRTAATGMQRNNHRHAHATETPAP